MAELISNVIDVSVQNVVDFTINEYDSIAPGSVCNFNVILPPNKLSGTSTGNGSGLAVFDQPIILPLSELTGASSGGGNATGVLMVPYVSPSDFTGLSTGNGNASALFAVPSLLIPELTGLASLGGSAEAIIASPTLDLVYEISGKTNYRATEHNFRVESKSYTKIRFVLEDKINVSGFNHVLIIQKSELNPAVKFRVDNPAIFGNTATFVLTPDLLNFTGRRWYEYWIQTGTQQWNKIFKGLIRAESSGIYLPN